jgi:hypothetical protein
VRWSLFQQNHSLSIQECVGIFRHAVPLSLPNNSQLVKLVMPTFFLHIPRQILCQILKGDKLLNLALHQKQIKIMPMVFIIILTWQGKTSALSSSISTFVNSALHNDPIVHPE